MTHPPKRRDTLPEYPEHEELGRIMGTLAAIMSRLLTRTMKLERAAAKGKRGKK